MIWWIGYATLAAWTAFSSANVKNLARLALILAGLSITSALIPETNAFYLWSICAEVLVIAAVITFSSPASTWVGRLSVLAIALHLGMFAWTHVNVWYNGYMAAYYSYPWLIRGIEAAQLLTIAWHSGVSTGRLHSRHDNKEPTCRNGELRVSI